MGMRSGLATSSCKLWLATSSCKLWTPEALEGVSSHMRCVVWEVVCLAIADAHMSISTGMPDGHQKEKSAT